MEESTEMDGGNASNTREEGVGTGCWNLSVSVWGPKGERAETWTSQLVVASGGSGSFMSGKREKKAGSGDVFAVRPCCQCYDECCRNRLSTIVSCSQAPASPHVVTVRLYAVRAVT